MNTNKLLLYSRGDLDDLTEGHEHYPNTFSVALKVFVTDTERKPIQPAPWFTDRTKPTPETVFSSQIEKDETIDNFGKYLLYEIKSKMLRKIFYSAKMYFSLYSLLTKTPVQLGLIYFSFKFIVRSPSLNFFWV